MTIKWDQSFSVGVKQIDLQHQKLFEILGHVEEQVKKDGKNFAALESIIIDLQAYIEFHFNTEQNFFEQFKYEGEKEHLAEHLFYVQKVKDLHDSCDKREEDLSKNMLDFVETWIQEHIKVSDKKYTKCFNEHGLV